MQVLKFSSETDWLAARVGKVTGSSLGDVLPKKNGDNKIGFYALIADALSEPDTTGLNPMERGHALEKEAIEQFTLATGKEVDTQLCILTRDDETRIAVSPDGIIGDGSEMVEVKCLSGARHIEAYLKQEIPSDYYEQVRQYYCVNDKLETLYFVFFNPFLRVKGFFIIEVKRSDVLAEIEALAVAQRQKLAEVDAIVATLTEF